MKASLVGLLILAALSIFLQTTPELREAMQGPSTQHWLGTDAQGRDLLVRLSEGLGLSLWVCLWASVVAMVIGSGYGAFAALKGGSQMMRWLDGINALPLTLFVVMITLYVGRSQWALFVAIGAIEWTTLARMTYARLMSVGSRDFVRASRSMGAGTMWIWWRHCLPYTWGVVLAYTALNLPAILILEATLSYLGLGVQPPHASLGVLLKEGAESMTVAPWLLWAPAVLFVWLLASVNLLGERLRARLPKD